MSNAQNSIKLYQTVVDECPYIEGEENASLVIDPNKEVNSELFSMLSKTGFRRSGTMLYSPKCPSCNACISVRIPSLLFKPSRSQKRVWKKNDDLHIAIEDVSFKQEHFDLYLRYQQHRHPESTMCDEDPDKYISFIDSEFSATKLICFYLKEQLIGISVVDQFNGGISAVYTFFDPDFSDRSIGTYAILYITKLARLRGIPYVYLGYWVDQSIKMDYKRKFKPLEGYTERKWSDLDL